MNSTERERFHQREQQLRMIIARLLDATSATAIEDLGQARTQAIAMLDTVPLYFTGDED